MKTIILNASPRRNSNTAQLLQSAQKGAESVGAETEYINLYDLNFTGCRSCMACKRKGAEPCKCYWKDDLSPVLERIFEADTILIGSPIYLGDTSSHFHAFLERMDFVTLSYNDYSCLFKGKLNVGILLTMNAPKQYYEEVYRLKLQDQMAAFERFGGSVKVYPCCDTLQVNDYSKYEMGVWNEQHKKEVHEKEFTKNLKDAFQIGAELSK
ncbi:MAG: flavodoxin family protein [Clostridium sp.]|nr:flavodoxin family protein [Clostridium sp.]